MKHDLEPEKELITREDAKQLPLPLDVFEANEIVRPEYNIGKYAGIIFSSPYAKNLMEVRQEHWEITDPDSDDVIKASLTITPSLGHKTPTTTTLRVYLALLQLWEHGGRPLSGVVRFSARQLAEVIGWKWAGKKTATTISDHITILKRTSINFVYSFNSKRAKNIGVPETIHDVSLLSSTTYQKRTDIRKKELYQAVHEVELSSRLVRNILEGYVRPVNYHALRKISNDSAANLYTRIDLYLSSQNKPHPKWECRSIKLFKEYLGLHGRRYEQKRLRLARMKTLVAQLNGAELINGKLDLSIETTNDGLDYKLVARKIPRIKPAKQRLKPRVSEEQAIYIADEIIERIKQHPRSGQPHKLYIQFLSTVYPEDLLHQALSIARADYMHIEKTLTHVFVYEVRQLVRKTKGLEWHKDLKKAR